MAEQEAEPPGASAPPEHAEFDFRGAYERSRNKRCTVAGVTLVGNTRTKDHIILRELPPVRLRLAATPARHDTERVLSLRRRRCCKARRWTRLRTGCWTPATG
jgi:hypothetical protein